MEQEIGISPSRIPSQTSWINLSRNLLLAYQSVGVVYGDLSTSPLYVYTSTFKGKRQHLLTEDAVFGAFSLIFWTLTLIPLLKYVFIVLNADDNGEGGTFALYSLLCRHAKFSLLPNQQAADEELSTYKYGHSAPTAATSPLKRFLEKHKKLRTALLLLVLSGASMVIGDGVLTPAISGSRLSSRVNGRSVRDQNSMTLLSSNGTNVNTSPCPSSSYCTPNQSRGKAARAKRKMSCTKKRSNDASNVVPQSTTGSRNNLSDVVEGLVRELCAQFGETFNEVTPSLHTNEEIHGGRSTFSSNSSGESSRTRENAIVDVIYNDWEGYWDIGDPDYECEKCHAQM